MNIFFKKINEFNNSLIKNSNLVNIFLIIIFYFSLQFARKFLPIAQETHFLAVEISSYLNKLDDGTFIYTFLRTPFYDFFIDIVFKNQNLFAFFSYLLPLVIIFFIYFLIIKVTNNSIYALMVALLFLLIPIIVKMLLVLGFHDAYGKITILYPRIDIWYRTFSVRQFHGLIFLSSLFFFYKEKYYFLILLTFVNLFIHPNSGLISSSFFILYFFIKSFNEKSYLKLFLITVIITLTFSVFKILSISESINWITQVSFSDWYLNLMRDELDDFSIIYRLKNNTGIFIVIILSYIISVWLFLKKKYFHLPSLLLIISILSVYLIFFLIEILIFYFKQYYLTQIFLPLQPGWKIVGYAIFPFFIFIYFALISKIRLVKFYFVIAILILFLSAFCIQFGVNENLEKTKYYFSNLKDKNVSYYDYIKLRKWNIDLARNIYNITNKEIREKVNFSNIFDKKRNEIKITVKQKLFFDNYHKKFNKFSCIEELNNFDKFIPDHMGLIIPPYFIQFRDFFSKKNIFFQEHHDGNLSMGNIRVFSYYDKKMRDLLGVSYIDLPPKTSGFQATFMRNIFLSLDEDHFTSLNKENFNYEYLITENIQTLSKLTILKKGNCFNLYKITD